MAELLPKFNVSVELMHSKDMKVSFVEGQEEGASNVYKSSLP